MEKSEYPHLYLCWYFLSLQQIISCLYLVGFLGFTLLLSVNIVIWVGNTQGHFCPLSLQLAKVYSYAHGWMHHGWNCGDYFPDGITNGASWYSLSKGKGRPGPGSTASLSRVGLPSPSELSFFFLRALTRILWHIALKKRSENDRDTLWPFRTGGLQGMLGHRKEIM